MCYCTSIITCEHMSRRGALPRWHDAMKNHIYKVDGVVAFWRYVCNCDVIQTTSRIAPQLQSFTRFLCFTHLYYENLESPLRFDSSVTRHLVLSTYISFSSPDDHWHFFAMPALSGLFWSFISHILNEVLWKNNLLMRIFRLKASSSIVLKLLQYTIMIQLALLNAVVLHY